jgi:integrase
MLRESPARAGFFEAADVEAVCQHLPAALVPVVRFAVITGWRIPSEVLTLQWHHVNLDAGEVRLDPGQTKNGEPRVFPFTADLKLLLETQHAEHERLKKAGQIVPWVFCRMVSKGRGGEKYAKRIRAFTKAWNGACVKAGHPGRIPHDLRRSAIRRMVRAGIPERVAMQLSGHQTRSVFERYNITSPADLLDAARRLDRDSPVTVTSARGRRGSSMKQIS